MLLQHIGARNHSLCTGWATSCATHCSNKSLCVLWGIVVKIFVSATEFCCRNKLHKFNLIWFCATCCGDKIQSWRQRFSQKFSSIHGVICRRDVMLQHVARVFWPVNEKLGSTLSHYPGSGCSMLESTNHQAYGYSNIIVNKSPSNR